MIKNKLSDYTLLPLYFLFTLGVYSILVGLVYMINPNLFFQLTNLDLPFYPFIWQCFGAFYVSMGISVLISALNPARFWPVLFLCMLSKLIVCVSFSIFCIQEIVPDGFIYEVIFNNLIWLPLLIYILYKIYALQLVVDGYNIAPFEEAIGSYKTNYDQSIAELSKDRVVLVVFLRHFGCVFCREILFTLNKFKDQISDKKIVLVVVHMLNNTDARVQLASYNLGDVDCVSDPDRNLYKSFGLRRGRLYQVFGLRVWWKGFVKGVLQGRGFGTEVGDILQMSGFFLLKDSKVIKSFIPEYISELPELPNFIGSIKNNEEGS